jgi:hypothetical protein
MRAIQTGQNPREWMGISKVKLPAFDSLHLWQIPSTPSMSALQLLAL